VRARALLFLAVFASLAAACGASHSPAAPQAHPAVGGPQPGSAEPAPGAPALDEFDDPVASGMTAVGVERLCDEHLEKADELLGRIRSQKGKAPSEVTYQGSLGMLDAVLLEIDSAGAFPYLMAVAHPDPAVREAAKACEPRTDRFLTSMWLDADVASVIRAYAQRGEALEDEKRRFLEHVLRDFRRNGLELPPAKQARLRELNEEMTGIGQDFMSAIGASRSIVRVPAAALEALPPGYVEAHPAGPDGKVEISTDYPDYFPFVTYSTDRRSALELYRKFVNRGGIGNVRRLERLLRLRREKAEMLGYPSWAEYAIEPRMAETSESVRKFLRELGRALEEPVERELEEFSAMHVKLGGKASDPLLPPDRYFLEDRVRADKYAFDSQALSAYLEIGKVKRGLMDITAKMYGLTYEKLDEQAWHPDVEAYAVLSGGKRIGKFYLDLHSRPDKYKHAAMFTIRTAKRLDDGRYQTPIASLVCNFPRPGAQAALMSHEDVVTFFHEFGHVLHHVLTESDLAYFSGTSTARDFVEAPSQMFEEWAWDRGVLDLFARHHETGEKIPDALFAAMKASRSFGRALSTQRQLFLATLDFEYHVRAPGFDTTQVLEQVQNQSEAFGYVKGTHFQSSFGHLISYDAGYYGYQWALALSRDVLTRFRAEGLMNAETARAFRRHVLARGGGADEAEMLTAFLGRPPNNDAYFRYLRGDE
jgi:thimet oligopeptidase